MNKEESQTKVECPYCGKDTFTNELNNETGKPFNSNLVGECKNQECNYTMTPKQFNAQCFRGFIMDNDLWSILELQNKPKYFTRTNIEDYNKEDLLKSGLAKFLCTNFEEKMVLETLSNYYVRTCETEPNVILTKYWYLDNKRNEFNTKFVSYDPVTGKCNSSDEKHLESTTTLKSSDNFRREQDENYIPNICLFGLHLIDSECTNQICLVEDERTAIIASIAYPDIVWVATGGQEINYALIKPLIGLDVVLFPTNNQYYKWKEIAEVYGFKLSTLLRINFNLPNTDLSDYILSKCDTWHN